MGLLGVISVGGDYVTSHSCIYTFWQPHPHFLFNLFMNIVFLYVYIIIVRIINIYIYICTLIPYILYAEKIIIKYSHIHWTILGTFQELWRLA